MSAGDDTAEKYDTLHMGCPEAGRKRGPHSRVISAWWVAVHALLSRGRFTIG